MRTTLCSSLTRCITSKWFVLFAVALLAMTIMAPPASAQANCLQDEYTASGGGSAVCTANDIRIAKAINIRDLQGNPLTQCASQGAQTSISCSRLPCA